MTPGAVLIGSGGSPVAIASDRVVMTLLGVLEPPVSHWG
jgi:hypothetical protein